MKALKVRNKKGFSIITLDEIMYCNSDRNYTILNLIDNRELKILYPIGKMEECLKNENFIRVHKKYIINNKHVINFDKEKCCITLVGDFEIPVCTRKKSCICDMIRITEFRDYFLKKANVLKSKAVVLKSAADSTFSIFFTCIIFMS